MVLDQLFWMYSATLQMCRELLNQSQASTWFFKLHVARQCQAAAKFTSMPESQLPGKGHNETLEIAILTVHIQT
jgi:hypothetical protein